MTTDKQLRDPNHICNPRRTRRHFLGASALLSTAALAGGCAERQASLVLDQPPRKFARVKVSRGRVIRTIAGLRPQVTGHFRIWLKALGPLVRPPLRLRVEYGPDTRDGDIAALEAELVARCRDDLRVRPVIEWLPPGTLPRETGKTNLIEIGADAG